MKEIEGDLVTLQLRRRGRRRVPQLGRVRAARLDRRRQHPPGFGVPFGRRRRPAHHRRLSRGRAARPFLNRSALPRPRPAWAAVSGPCRCRRSRRCRSSPPRVPKKRLLSTNRPLRASSTVPRLKLAVSMEDPVRGWSGVIGSGPLRSTADASLARWRPACPAAAGPVGVPAPSLRRCRL